MLATANIGKLGRGFGEKKFSNGLGGQKFTRKKFLAVSVACIAISWPTLGFKGKTSELLVLNVNSYVRSSLLREVGKVSPGVRHEVPRSECFLLICFY